MISGYQTVALVDVDSSMDKETGDLVRFVKRGKLLTLNIDLVGLQTLQLGQSQGIVFSYSVEIPRFQYNQEKFCYFDNTLFEIKGFSKAKQSVNMLLNVAKNDDSDIVSCVESWLEEKYGS